MKKLIFFTLFLSYKIIVSMENIITIAKNNNSHFIVKIENLNLKKLSKEIKDLVKNYNKTMLLLSLSNNNLYNLPIQIKIKNLRTLDLSNNKLTKIPNKELKNIPNLSKLDLSNNQIEKITNKDWKALNYLKKINLSNNKIIEITNGINQCQFLEKLNLSNNQIKKISGKVGYLNLLKFLNLSNNQITTFPKDLGKFNNTIAIYLDGNKLKNISKMVRRNRKFFELLVFLFKNKIFYRILENIKVEFENQDINPEIKLKKFEKIKRNPKEDSQLLPQELVNKIHEYSGI